MPESFLHYIARYVSLKFPEEPDRICLVFSNRRARLFYQRELSRLNNEVQWLPDILSMEDFVQQLSGVSFGDPMRLLFEFYEVYLETEGAAAEPFEQFSTWAGQLLHDFEETDLYMIDAVKLYQHVDEAYAIKNWSPDGSTLTRNQEQYLRFWSRMGIWYSRLKSRLQQRGIQSQAMAFRLLAEQAELFASEMPWKHVIFAGFNALNQAEQRFINTFEKHGLATLIWDADHYYLDHDLNEAGYFMRHYSKTHQLKEIQHTGNFFAELDKNIRITGVSKNTGQAVFAGGILKELYDRDPELKDTALVLCDEQLLMPVLEYLPEQINKVNVTMGYPLFLLPESGLFQLCFDLQLHARKSGKTTSWYHKDLVRLFQHPLLERLVSVEYLRTCQRLIVEGKHVFISYEKLIKLCGDSGKGVLLMILSPWNNQAGTALQNLRSLIDLMRNEISDQQQSHFSLVQREALFCIFTLLNKLQTYQDEYSGLDSIKTLHRFFEQLLKQTTLPFYGEPLDGLQIMGLLETRNLDFRNVILLSVNEGILPKGRTQNSFIPFDLSAAYGLPTYRERDAVFAWHFYRLLQRAENVWLIYNTEPDEFAKGEKSRFITQIEEELKFPGITISRDTWVPEIAIPADQSIRIDKTDGILNRLQERFGREKKRYLSPSALNQYLQCSLRFYFKYLSGIKIEESIEEEIGADVLGTTVHKVLQDFFEPLKQKKLLPEHYKRMLEEVPEKVKECFLAVVDEEDLMHGKNLLTYRGAEQMILNYLKTEMQMLEQQDSELILLDVERNLDWDLFSDALSSDKKLLIGGYADRIDMLDGVIRIIDYKTGTVDHNKLKIDLTADPAGEEINDKALQLLLYKHLAGKLYPGKEIIAGIISLRSPSKGLMVLKEDDNNQEALDECGISDFFRSIVGELMNPEIPFTQTSDYENCKYCDFQAICNRRS
jgi:ATP-dependent helicase/nuclease subunit B